MLLTLAGIEPVAWSPVGRASDWATECGWCNLLIIIIIIIIINELKRPAVQVATCEEGGEA